MPPEEKKPVEEEQKEEQREEELHTLHEAELVNQIAELNKTIKTLQEQNRKMFLKLSGEEEEEQEDVNEMIDRMIFEHIHAKDYLKRSD